MFTHLHVHTEFSLLDGACRIKELVSRAKEMGMTSLAITDHGNMYGAVDFYKECKRQGIKPIIGCEVYVAPHSRFDKDKVRDKNYHHLILLCKNEIGYKNLIKIVSQSFTEGFYFKPRVDKELIEKYNEGLICLSACLAGEIPQLILNQEYSQAKDTALWFNSVFGDGNYYLELQDHGLQEQKIVLDALKRISNETNIPLVATNDVHYIEKEDSKIQQVLICIATNHTLGEDTGLEFHAQEFYLKSEEEMKSIFLDVPESIFNTQKIADQCNFDFEFGNTKLPYFEVPNNKDHFEYFKELCLEGMIKRYGQNPPKEYYDRLDYELKTVETMGYTDYYLIVSDFVNFAKSKDIPVGPGRGSGAGSIAAYCIGITDLDPMKYNLIFERFLNPERVSMPDFDIDFCYERRQEVIDYVTQKYGSDHVAQIVTFGTLATRAAIRDVGRALGMPYSQVDQVAKLVPQDFKITIDEAIKKSKELRELIDSNDQVKNLIEIAKKVEGMPRNTSTHAAGVVITHDPVASYVPLATNDDVIVTQYIMTSLEELGLLKMDFLGLRTLTVIDDASKSAGIDIENIDITDQNVFKLFQRGQTEGVFQFESSGMKVMLTNLKPTSLEDLIAATSLYRPGPAKQIDTFVENSHNPSKVSYITPMLEPVLKNTYGCMVYQEQVMQIFRELAGYSFGRADIVRRAMSKKKKDVMQKERATFVDGCAKNNISEDIANTIFDQMEDFAKYAFNKSHAACYALVAFRTAYLKCYYPAQFMAALMTSVLEQSNKIARYTVESKRLGLKLAPPNVNTSMRGFTASDKTIHYGLLGIKNVGRDFVDEIVAERQNGEFKDLSDFCKRMATSHFNRRAIESLIRCGALDCFSFNRRQMLQMLPAIVSMVESQRQSSQYGQVGFFDLGSNSSVIDSVDVPKVEEFPKSELLKMEKEMTGLYLSGHPLDKYYDICSQMDYVSNSELLDASNPNLNEINSKYKDKSIVKICGIISHVSLKTTRNGDDMAFIKVEDISGEIEIIVFPKVLLAFAQMLYEGNIISVKGYLSLEEEKDAKILANEILPAPTKNDLSDYQNKKQAKTSNNYSKQEKLDYSKYKKLYLRFDTKNSTEFVKAKRITDIFDEGKVSLYYYYNDTKQYEFAGNNYRIEVNKTMINELKKLLGNENVVLK